jgi:hypothetical protein
MIVIYVGLHIVSVILVRLMKIEFSQQSFEKFSNNNFHENPSTWNRVVPFGQTDRYDKPIVAFRNFAKAPKNQNITVFTKYRHLTPSTK